MYRRARDEISQQLANGSSRRGRQLDLALICAQGHGATAIRTVD